MTSRTSKADCDCASRKAEWDLHPQVGRAVSNLESGGDVAQGHVHDHSRTEQTPQTMEAKGPCQCGRPEWDLHPAAIRKIENEGSEADVKQLHDLENSCNATERKL